MKEEDFASLLTEYGEFMFDVGVWNGDGRAGGRYDAYNDLCDKLKAAKQAVLDAYMEKEK